MKFCTSVHLKSSNDRGEFELDRAKSKNNIAEKKFVLGHETHNIIHPLCFSKSFEISISLPLFINLRVDINFTLYVVHTHKYH